MIAGFNGAATFPSRKLLYGGLGLLAVAGFNGAATFPSRKFALLFIGSGDSARLQWGRDVSVAEVKGRSCRLKPAGSLQWVRDVSVAEVRENRLKGGLARAASMGPRRFRRGSHALTADLARRCALQWGRDVSVAEVTPPQRPAKGPKLQWGRDVSVAEVVHRPKVWVCR